MAYAAYVPKDLPRGVSVPLVIFLHGGGDDPHIFDEVEMGQTFDTAVADGRLPSFVAVFPEGELGLWENWYDGSHRYEDWVMDDLLSHARDTLPVASCPEHCAIMGVSMGGHGALRFALHRPQEFDSVAAISAPIFNTDQMIEFADWFIARVFMQSRRIFGPTDNRQRVEKEDLYLRWQSPDDVAPLRLFFAWGTREHDRIISANESFTSHLKQRGIEHQSIVYDGRHKWVDWKPVILALLQEMLSSDQKAP